MNQAAVDGLINFQQARLEDPTWQRHVFFRLMGLQRKNRRELEKLKYSETLALLSRQYDDSAIVQKLFDQAAEQYAIIRSTYFPSEKVVSAEELTKERAKQDAADWHSVFDLATPEETLAATEETIRLMRAQVA